MSRQCSVCTHERRAEIDEAIVAGTVALRRIAVDNGVSETALRRHAKNHIAKSLTNSKQAMDAVLSDDLFKKIEVLEVETTGIKATALEAGNLNVALTCIDRMARLIELYGKMKGMVKDFEVNVGVQVNINEVMGVSWTWLDKHYPKIAQALREHMGTVYDARYTVE